MQLHKDVSVLKPLCIKGIFDDTDETIVAGFCLSEEMKIISYTPYEAFMYVY